MYFRTYVSDKGYIPRIRKELQTNRGKKRMRDLKGHFTKRTHKGLIIPRKAIRETSTKPQGN